MKKHILLLAGSAMILASCGSNNNENQQNEQAKMDSIAKANAALQDEINKKRNDSTINAMAAAKADSMAAATKAEETKKSGTKKTTTKTTTTSVKVEPHPVPATAPVKSAQDAKFDRRNMQNDNATPKLTPEQQKQQDDKFNRRK